MRSALLGVLLGLGLLTQAQAGAISVTPTRLAIDSSERFGTLVLENRGDAASLVQLSAHAWQDGDNTSIGEPTQDLVVVPPVVEIPARGRQIVRLASRSASANAMEASYRLRIQEVPTEVGPALGVRIALNINMPVFVTPPGGRPDVSWSLLAAEQGGWWLQARNTGNAHLRVREPSIATSAEAGFRIDDIAYVLAGQSKRWHISAEAGLRSGMTAVLAGKTPSGDLNARVMVP
ncbi:MAG: molecular chaperone [Geminicoccaceae bacterium]